MQREFCSAPGDGYAAVEAPDELETLLIYREFGVADDDMDLFLQLAFIAPMCLDGELTWRLADLLEVMHPYHAGACIVRGVRAQAEGRFEEAFEMYLAGTEAELKAEESAVYALKLLEQLDLAESDPAGTLRGFLSRTAKGQRYLRELAEDDEVSSTVSEEEVIHG